jgi:mannosyl-oligosaccharide alpha-1,2-mannosidase
MFPRMSRRFQAALLLAGLLLIVYKKITLAPSKAFDGIRFDRHGSDTDPFRESTDDVEDRMHPKIKAHLEGAAEKDTTAGLPRPGRPFSPEPTSESAAAVAPAIPRPVFDEKLASGNPQDPGMLEDSGREPFDLDRLESFPVLPGRMIPLPLSAPVKIPSIQAKTPTESAAQKKERLARRDAVRATFQRDWASYRQHAWMHDEIEPVSNGTHDPFGGWGATLVDALDTLLIMGFKDEYKEAEAAVASIDFTRMNNRILPVFETTIRYLGGLLAAHDLAEAQGMKDTVMLKQATILGKVLYGAFDTPNRMPILKYDWNVERDRDIVRASRNSVMAEVGSLSVEFTRLAQLSTGKDRDRLYDAIARITNELEDAQDQMALPGLWPVRLDLSGCKEQFTTDKLPNENVTSGTATKGRAIMQDRRQAEKMGSVADAQAREADRNDKGMPVIRNSMSSECDYQGILPSEGPQIYSLGAMADSTYEYLTKEFLLLGGVKEAEQYKRLYERAIEVAKKNLLYKPLVPGDLGRDKLLLAGSIGGEQKFRPSMQHLTCFVGGMFGMGAKVFQRPEDLDIAIKLTEGCVWAYSATASGIMPETFDTFVCKTNKCSWEEQLAHWKKEFEASEGSNQPEWAVDMAKQPVSPQDGARSAQKANANPFDKRDEIHKGSLAAAARDDPNTEAARLQAQALDAAQQRSNSRSEFRRPWAEPSPLIIHSSAYILRPEAIESVWYMWRITGDRIWQEKGWKMWQAVEQHTRAAAGHSAIHDVDDVPTLRTDHCESFWFAETLKYFYLLFADFDVISLDEYVLNTEAHPFKLRGVA